MEEAWLQKRGWGICDAQHAQHQLLGAKKFGGPPMFTPLASPMAAMQQRPRLIDELLTPDFLAEKLLPFLSTRDYFRASGVCRCCTGLFSGLHATGQTPAPALPTDHHWPLRRFTRVAQSTPTACRAWRDAVLQEAPASSSPRHWGRLEATTRGNATLDMAAEPAWAAAFQPAQADDVEDAPAAFAALAVPGVFHLPVLSQAAWQAEQLAADFGGGGSGSGGSRAQLDAEQLLQVVGRLMGPGVAGVVHLQRQHPGMQRQSQQQEQEEQQQLLGFWGTALLAIMCSEGGQGVSGLIE